MTDRDPNVARALAEYVPPFANDDVDAEWRRLLIDAAVDAPRPRQPRRRIWTRWDEPNRVRRSVVLASAAALIVALPALAFSTGMFGMRDAPSPATDVVTVMSVETPNRGTLDVLAYVSDEEGICVALVRSGREDADLFACGSGVAADAFARTNGSTRAIGITVSRTSSSEVIFGPVSPEIQALHVELEDGGIVAAETVVAPSLNADVRFYAVSIPAGRNAVAVIGFDSEGEMRERRSIPT